MKVSDPPSTANQRCSLLCVSNKFGLTYIGCDKGESFRTAAMHFNLLQKLIGVQVFPTSILYQVDSNEDLKDKGKAENLEKLRN